MDTLVSSQTITPAEKSLAEMTLEMLSRTVAVPLVSFQDELPGKDALTLGAGIPSSLLSGWWNGLFDDSIIL